MCELPSLSDVQHLSLSDLHTLLETSFQLLLPKVHCCTLRFLHEVVSGRKAALPLLHARHFHVHRQVRVPQLLELCGEEEAEYLPEGTRDRDFLVQLLATLKPHRLAQLHLRALTKRQLA